MLFVDMKIEARDVFEEIFVYEPPRVSTSEIPIGSELSRDCLTSDMVSRLYRDIRFCEVSVTFTLDLCHVYF